MTALDGLLLADEKGYLVKNYKSPLKSFSVVAGATCAIAINFSALEPGEELTALFHELGHCETRSFYNQFSPFDVQQKHENRADKWAIQKLIPKDELDTAVERGLKAPWELAEYFGVTEDFVKKAVCYYANGNLAIEYY